MDKGWDKISIQLDGVREDVDCLKNIFMEMGKMNMSNYKCPVCGTVLCYDFIGKSHTRLYCNVCEKYVLALHYERK